MSVPVSQFAQAVITQLERYKDERTEQVIKETAALIKETDQVVKQHITFNSISGDYIRSMATKKVTAEFNIWSYVWYVKKPNYRLTHLLERSHKMPNGSMSKAYPHITFGNEYAVRKYQEIIGRTFGNG